MSARQSALLASVLLVAATVVGITGAVAQPAGASADPVTIQGTFDVARGDVVQIPITVPAGANATIYVQRTTNAVTSRAVLADEDGNGRIVAVLNTYTGRLSTRGDDRVVSSRVPREPPLPADTYSVSVESADGAGRSTLRVRAGALDRLAVWRAPNGTPNVSSAAAVRSAIADGHLVRATALGPRDHLVIQVNAPGLTGAYDAASAANETERLHSVLSTHGRLSIVERYPTPEQRRAHLAVFGPGTTVLPDPTNGTFYVGLNLSKVPVLRGDDPAEHFAFEEQYFRVTLGLDAASNLTAGNETLRAYVDDPVAQIDRAPDDRVHLFPTGNQTVTGTTTVGTGLNVTVVVHASDDPETDQNESFVRRTDATVRSTESERENTFRATLDLQDAPTATPVQVDIRFENQSLLEAHVQGRIAGTASSLAVRGVEHQTYTQVRVDVGLARGGFVVLHAGSPDGPVVGTSQYLPPGQTNARVYVGRPTDAETVVAVAHADTNHNEWFDGPGIDTPYQESATATVDVARVTPSTTSPRTTTSSRSTTASSVTTTIHPDPGARVPVPSMSAAVAFLVVVVASTLLAARRRR